MKHNKIDFILLICVLGSFLFACGGGSSSSPGSIPDAGSNITPTPAGGEVSVECLVSELSEVQVDEEGLARFYIDYSVDFNNPYFGFFYTQASIIYKPIVTADDFGSSGYTGARQELANYASSVDHIDEISIDFDYDRDADRLHTVASRYDQSLSGEVVINEKTFQVNRALATTGKLYLLIFGMTERLDTESRQFIQYWDWHVAELPIPAQ